MAVVAALVIHAAVFVALPAMPSRRPAELDPPIYVALAPVDDAAPPRPDVAEAPPESPPTEDTPTEPLPADEALAADDPPSPSEEAPAQEAPPTAAEVGEEAPATEPPVAEQPPATEPPVTETPPATEPPATAAPDFVPMPEAPPPGPRPRTTDGIRSGDAAARDAAFVESQMDQFYRWQRRNEAELAEWRARQAARATDPAATAADTTREDSVFADALARTVEAIRSASSNVVDTADPTPDPVSDETTGGDGSGIAVDGPGGARHRTRGAAVDLQGVTLQPGVPPEYPVQVRFRVGADGRVTDARVFPPTPETDLNTAIEEAVGNWRFQPASDPTAEAVTGFVTIIVQTR